MDRNRVLSTAAGVLVGLLAYTIVVSLVDSRYLALPVKTRIEKGISDAAGAERKKREAAREAERDDREAAREAERKKKAVEDANKTLYERYDSTFQCVKEEGKDMADECEASFEKEERSTSP